MILPKYAKSLNFHFIIRNVFPACLIGMIFILKHFILVSPLQISYETQWIVSGIRLLLG